MKLIACIKKDIKLICGNGAKGILLLVFPIALLLLLSLFMSGMANENNYMKPFSIAIQDEDDTFESRILITQLRNIPLFESVEVSQEVNVDEAFRNGCAAVLTVPKDFFYDVYDMQDTDVRIILNGNMPREAYAVRSAIGSVIGILEKNQRVYYADARMRYGEIDREIQNDIFAQYSAASAEGALDRLTYFEIDSLYSDTETSQSIFFCVGVVSMVIMFIPLCIVRNLHEEKELGIIERLAASSSGSFHMVLSKLLASALISALPIAAMLIITKVPYAVRLIPALMILFLASFAFFLLLSLICRSSERTQLIGNTILVLMLVVGGALFPQRLIPSAVRYASVLTIPYYVSRSFYAVSLGRSVSDTLKVLIPLIAAIPVLFAGSYMIYKRPAAIVRRRK